MIVNYHRISNMNNLYLQGLHVSDDDHIKMCQIAYLYHNQQQRLIRGVISSLTLGPEMGRCIAKIHDGTQCSRKYHDHLTQFCNSHMQALPYGVTVPNQRRPSSPLTNEPDLSLYIRTRPIVIQEVNYLIDDNGVIYENCDTNTIKGRQVDGVVCWWT